MESIEAKLLAYLSEKNPLHAKKLNVNLQAKGGMYRELGSFLGRYRPYMDANGISSEDLGDAYLTMVNQMTCARVAFLKTGKYPAEEHSSVVSSVYLDKKVMKTYMLGLALSQFLWKHHFELLTFYRSHIMSLQRARSCLEVGSGHGLFLLELLTARKDLESVRVVDISDISLELTKSLVQVLSPENANRVHFTHADIQEFRGKDQFDFITMGEVLEHVRDPFSVLKSLHGVLANDGRVYISTCINCPTIDHIYQFHSVSEIHDVLRQCGFSVVAEIISPSEDFPPEKLEKFKLDISYGAILKKA